LTSAGFTKVSKNLLVMIAVKGPRENRAVFVTVVRANPKPRSDVQSQFVTHIP